MYGKTRNITAKPNSVGCGKRGFTLVELSVVLALVVILTAMTVSFSVLMNGYAAESEAEYGYLEDHADLKDALCDWLAEMDVSDNEFVANGGTLTVGQEYFGTVVGEEVSFSDGKLIVKDSGETEPKKILLSGLENIESIVFIVSDDFKLIKCITTSRGGESGQTIMTNSFVFARRCVGGS